MSCLHSRGAGRRHSFLCRHAAAAALGAGMLAAGPAAARDSVTAWISSLGSPSIVVASNGSSYYSVDPSSDNIDGQMKVILDAGVIGGVKSFEIWPRLWHPVLKSADFKGTGISWSRSYSVPRPKRVEETFSFSIPRAHYQQFAIASCNAQADLLRAQGLSNGAIFAQDRSTEIRVEHGLDYEMSGPSGTPTPGQVPGTMSFNVTCKGVPPRVPTPVAEEPTRNKPEVEQATLAVLEEGSLRGACSVHLSGVIRSKHPNTQAKFRYHSDDGRKSDLKTVSTDQTATAMFSHEYPLSEGGTRSGKVRIVGEFPDFVSDWVSYRVNCGSPAQGYASNDPAPPDLTMLVGTVKEKLYQGFICPAKVGLDTRILANDPMEGRAIHIARQQGVIVEPQQQVSEMDFKVVKGQKFAAGAAFDMKWSNIPVVGNNPPKQTMKFIFQAARHHTVIAEIEETVVLSCRKPEMAGVAQGAADGVAPTEPAQPKSVTLSVSPLGLKRIPGYSCPHRARVHGFVQSGDVPLGGTVGLFVNGSLVKQHPVDLPANTSHNYDTEYTFPWNAATQTEQTLSFTLKYANPQGHVVKTVEKHESFACSSIETGGVAQGAVGGVIAGKPAPAAQLQAFAIQAPKGLVRKGEIRLSGGAANAKYSLKFLRKNGGGYVAVNAAQLPRQMTGLVASFPLKALSGGRDWRLEVCPDGGAPNSCKTADFRLTRIGAGAGGTSSPAPSPEQPQSTIFLLPGVGQ